MKKHYSLLTLFLFFGLLLSVNTPGDTLRDAADSRGIMLGAAVNEDKFSEGDYSRTLSREFNAVVAGNSMKFSYLQPREGSFTFSRADSIVDFAEKNDMAVRGHTLLWHSDYQVPDWVKQKESEEMIAIVEAHIQEVMTHFNGQIYAWDVANEVLTDSNPPVFRNRQSSGGNYSVWAESASDDSVFRAAFHKADEVRKALNDDVKLFLCDYNNEEMGHYKADKFYYLVRKWKDDGVPIDGVAFQLHLIADNPLDFGAIRDNIDRFQALGLEVQFTEVDVRVLSDPPPGYKASREQQKIYRELIKIAKEKGIQTFIIWGVTDKYSWIPDHFSGMGHALIFDEEYRPKKSYFGLKRELQR